MSNFNLKMVGEYQMKLNILKDFDKIRSYKYYI